jgi:hypothetical protein
MVIRIHRNLFSIISKLKISKLIKFTREQGRGGLGVGVAGDGRGEVRPDGELGRWSSGDGVGAVYGEFESEESERERASLGREREREVATFIERGEGRREGDGEGEKRSATNSIDGHQWRSSLREREKEKRGGGEGAVDGFRLRGRTGAAMRGTRARGSLAAAAGKEGRWEKGRGARWGPPDGEGAGGGFGQLGLLGLYGPKRPVGLGFRVFFLFYFKI